LQTLKLKGFAGFWVVEGVKSAKVQEEIWTPKTPKVRITMACAVR